MTRRFLLALLLVAGPASAEIVDLVVRKSDNRIVNTVEPGVAAPQYPSEAYRRVRYDTAALPADVRRDVTRGEWTGTAVVSTGAPLPRPNPTQEILDACLTVEADAAAPANVKLLCVKLRSWVLTHRR